MRLSSCFLTAIIIFHCAERCLCWRGKVLFTFKPQFNILYVHISWLCDITTSFEAVIGPELN